MFRHGGFAAEVQLEHSGTSQLETQQSDHECDCCHAAQSMFNSEWCTTHTYIAVYCSYTTNLPQLDAKSLIFCWHLTLFSKNRYSQLSMLRKT